MEHKNYYAIIPATVRYDKKLPDGAKLLYGEITALCNQQGFCWAGNQYFADLYGKSVSSVKRWLSTLEERGYIIRNFRYKEGTSEIDERCITICDTPVQKCTQVGANDTGVGSKIVRTPVQKCDDPRFKNEPDNITVNNTREEEPPISPNEETFIEAVSVSCQKIADQYNSICVSLPKITRLSDARKKAIKARLKNYSQTDFLRLFEMAESSDFLKGQNSRDWSANFDWLIKDSNMAKVLDGNYCNKSSISDNRPPTTDWSNANDEW